MDDFEYLCTNTRWIRVTSQTAQTRSQRTGSQWLRGQPHALGIIPRRVSGCLLSSVRKTSLDTVYAYNIDSLASPKTERRLFSSGPFIPNRDGRLSRSLYCAAPLASSRLHSFLVGTSCGPRHNAFPKIALYHHHRPMCLILGRALAS